MNLIIIIKMMQLINKFKEMLCKHKEGGRNDINKRAAILDR